MILEKIKSEKINKLISLFLTILIGISFCTFPSLISAQEEQKSLRIMYQGNLTDSEGNVVDDGRYNMRFTIYDSKTEGGIVWQEEYVFYNTIFVKDGEFKVILGRRSIIDLNFSEGTFWLGINLGTETEEGDIIWDIGSQPRKKIVSLSALIENEGMKGGEIEDISRFIEERIGDESDSVVLFDLDDIQEVKTRDEDGSLTLGVFKNFMPTELANIIKN